MNWEDRYSNSGLGEGPLTVDSLRGGRGLPPPPPPPPRAETPRPQASLLKKTKYGVEGEVKVEGDKIVVENFSYDGTAPDAFFYVGTSGCPSGAGTRLGGDKPLGRHSRQRVELELPNNIRAGDLTFVSVVLSTFVLCAGDVTWVSVWCRNFSVDFGHAFLSPKEDCSSGSPESGSSGNGLYEYEI